MTADEQELKVKILRNLQELWSDDDVHELFSNAIGFIPENCIETMADAAMAVIMAIKGTNEYRDNNAD